MTSPSGSTRTEPRSPHHETAAVISATRRSPSKSERAATAEGRRRVLSRAMRAAISTEVPVVRGERFDGHAFVEQAFHQGATAAALKKTFALLG